MTLLRWIFHIERPIRVVVVQDTDDDEDDSTFRRVLGTVVFLGAILGLALVTALLMVTT